MAPRALARVVDEKKAYGIMLAVGRSVGEAARERPELLAALRAVADAHALERVLLEHRGALPEALVRDYVASIPPADFVKERARLVIQAKTVAAGIDPVSPEEARKGPVRQR